VYSFKGFTKLKIKSIKIPIFENCTQRYGIEEKITKEIIAKIREDGRVKVEEKAEGILYGKILSYSNYPFSYDSEGNVKEYRIDMKVEIVCKNKEDTVIVKKTIEEWTSYPIEVEEEKGIEDVSKKISEKIVRNLIEEE
jgi:outer membrane lipopolysaccharide assembly protein LptE/RlpB